jgi:hypothetical protein
LLRFLRNWSRGKTAHLFQISGKFAAVRVRCMAFTFVLSL